MNARRSKKFTKNSRSAGFTLMELMIVIATIGLIATVSIGALGTTRAKSRDTRRIEDLQSIRKALDLYYADHSDYPPSPCGYNCNGYYYSDRTAGATGWNNLAALLQPYINRLPTDPINNLAGPWTNGHYSYAYGNVGSLNFPANPFGPSKEPTYDLTGQFESPNHPERCGMKKYRFFFTDALWCGSYSNQIYEASPF